MGRQVGGGGRGSIRCKASGGITIVTVELAGGTVSEAYSQTLEAARAPAPFEWEVTAGTLPDDLSLNASTGEISGTPSVGDTFTFTVQVTGANGAVTSKEFTIIIDPGIG